MNKYYVTYGVMDGEAGANPLWHAFLMLSTQYETGHVEVIDAVGFYSQPSTTTNPIHRGIKDLLGFKVDLQDGHGITQQEKMRDLDKNGLHGVSFEITSEQFTALQNLYKKNMRLEREAIEELNLFFGDSSNGFTRYIGEQSISEQSEKSHLPRLKPFHITMELTHKGLNSHGSHACKNYALNLLLESQIINEETHKKILGGAAGYAFPRFSQLIQPLKLVSIGEPEKHHSRSNQTFYNRVWGNNKLFWATSPLPINSIIPVSALAQEMNQNRCEYLCNVLNRVSEIELALRKKLHNLPSFAPRHQSLQIQIDRVQALYDLFSNTSENEHTHLLSTKLHQAEKILNVATLALTPSKANSSFMLRAYESVYIRNALLCLLGLAIAAAFLGGPVGIVWMSAATLAASHQLYGFYKEERKFLQTQKDYKSFQDESTAVPLSPKCIDEQNSTDPAFSH